MESRMGPVKDVYRTWDSALEKISRRPFESAGFTIHAELFFISRSFVRTFP